MRRSSLLILLLLAGCMPGAKTFENTSENGHLKQSDLATHSRAQIQREGSVVTVQGAYRFDLRHLVDVDRGYVATDDSSQTDQTRDEAVISMAIHGAFGLGTFNPVLDRLDSDWARQVMGRTRVGKPFFVRSLNPERDDYWVVPVFYRDRWAVASHVGVRPRGTFYSNGFTVPNMAFDATASERPYGRSQLDAWSLERFGHLPDEARRVWLDTLPGPSDAVLGYAWLVTEGSRSLVVSPLGGWTDLSSEDARKVRKGEALTRTVPLQEARP